MDLEVMHMKNLLLPITVIILSMMGLSGQDCQYEKYFYWTSMAQIDFSEGDFEEARREFRIAFSTTEFPLGADLGVALETAIRTRDTTWAEELSIALAKGGIPLIYFDSLRNYPWYEHFAADFDQYDHFYETQYNLELRVRFMELVLADSLFNEDYHSWRKGEREMTLEELIAGAKGISTGLQVLIDAYGFPCEQKMGYLFKEGQVRPFPLVILLIHIYQRGELFYKDRLDRIICDGKLKPTDRAILNGARGFGDSSGVEQEMQIRYNKYRPKR
ncbi:MAG: hypothetical protein KDC41_05270 [Saprospiraceae bacterium]|nr:hypothetical protein [Saprospiraceae bacterium]